MGLFGPSKEEVWKQLSDEIHADYIKGGFWSGSKVEAHVDNWIIVLDTYTVSTGKSSMTYTRMRSPFKNLGDFYFRIYRKGFFSAIGELMGMHDIEVGFEEFDDDFVIKSNDEKRVTQLFANENIRKLFEMQPSMNLEIKDDEGFFGNHFPQNVDELYFSVGGVIKNTDHLKELFEIFAWVLKDLSDFGIISNEKADVVLK